MKIKIKLAALIVVGILLLAGAAFIAFGLASPNTGLFAGLQLPGLVQPPVGKKAGGQQFTMEYAPEFPRTDPAVVGPLAERRDNSLFVEHTAKPERSDLPPLEVLIGPDTKLVRNATSDHLSGAIPAGSTVQQVLEPYTLDQIQVGDNIIAWGDLRGDRLVADFVMVETANR